MTRRTAGLLLFALALASCGEMRWQKPGGDDASLVQDQAACDRKARDMYGNPNALLPPAGISPRFGPTAPTQTDVVMRESQVSGACMRDKGYVLVPK
jgi:hypothetical protein